MGKDDHYIPMDTETVEQPTSFKNRARSFIASAFLFLVVVGLASLLVIQIIVISSTVHVSATADHELINHPEHIPKMPDPQELIPKNSDPQQSTPKNSELQNETPEKLNQPTDQTSPAPQDDVKEIIVEIQSNDVSVIETLPLN